jgi:hypothetical protein
LSGPIQQTLAILNFLDFRVKVNNFAETGIPYSGMEIGNANSLQISRLISNGIVQKHVNAEALWDPLFEFVHVRLEVAA